MIGKVFNGVGSPVIGEVDGESGVATIWQYDLGKTTVSRTSS